MRYREIELSLPNELSLEQNLEIVDRFIANHLSSHYYAYAIHEKAGELSGERHPHVHIMFSERLIDDVEKIQERPACKYFRRAAKPLKGEKIASFKRRREHAPKLLEELIGDCCPAVVRYLDEDNSKIDCNEILAKEGVDALRSRLADIQDDSVAELAAIEDDFAKKKDARQGDSDLNSLFKGNDSDLTFARRLEKFCGADVRWLTDDEQWLLYRNGVWQRGSEKNSYIAHLGRSLADTLVRYATTNTEKDLAEKFQSAKKITAEVHLPLILRISAKIPHYDVLNLRKKFVTRRRVINLQFALLSPEKRKNIRF